MFLLIFDDKNTFPVWLLYIFLLRQGLQVLALKCRVTRRCYVPQAGLESMIRLLSSSVRIKGMYHNVCNFKLYFAYLQLVKCRYCICFFLKPWVTYQSQHRIGVRILIVLLSRKELKVYLRGKKTTLVLLVLFPAFVNFIGSNFKCEWEHICWCILTDKWPKIG